MAIQPDAPMTLFFEFCFAIQRERDQRKWDAMIAALPPAARGPCQAWLDVERYPDAARRIIPPERITHVAIQIPASGQVYKLRAPRRHHHVIHLMAAKRVPQHPDQIQGFWTNRKRFVDRLEGMTIAIAAGQLKRREGANYYQGPELFSEDLWSSPIAPDAA